MPYYILLYLDTAWRRKSLCDYFSTSPLCLSWWLQHYCCCYCWCSRNKIFNELFPQIKSYEDWDPKLAPEETSFPPSEKKGCVWEVAANLPWPQDVAGDTKDSLRGRAKISLKQILRVLHFPFSCLKRKEKAVGQPLMKWEGAVLWKHTHWGGH